MGGEGGVFSLTSQRVSQFCGGVPRVYFSKISLKLSLFLLNFFISECWNKKNTEQVFVYVFNFQTMTLWLLMSDKE